MQAMPCIVSTQMSRVRTLSSHAATWIAVALFALAAVRAIALWAHEPMLAYANNFDQIRAMRALRLQPVKPAGHGSAFAGTPYQPWRYFSKGQERRTVIYPSSDLLVKGVQIGITKLWRSTHDPLDIKQFSAPLLAFWLGAVGWIAWQMARASPCHSLGFCAWLVLISDPLNLLFLNTLYAEFSAFVAFSIFIGTCWLALARRYIGNGLMLAAFAALLVLATNRNQYMYLPLALSPLLALAWHKRAVLGLNGRLFALAAALTLVAPLLLFGAQPGQLKETNHANRINTVFGAMLPAASDPADTLRLLKLPPDCLQFSSHSWYDTPTTQYNEQCPTIFQLPLPRLLPALLADPVMLARMSAHVAGGYRGSFNGVLQENSLGCFTPQFLGHVEGAPGKHIDDLQHTPLLQSLDSILIRQPRELRRAVILTPTFLPALLAVLLILRKKKLEALALAGVQILALYFFFSSLLGDGYADFERHAVLYPSAGALLLLAVPGALWRSR